MSASKYEEFQEIIIIPREFGGKTVSSVHSVHPVGPQNSCPSYMQNSLASILTVWNSLYSIVVSWENLESQLNII